MGLKKCPSCKRSSCSGFQAVSESTSLSVSKSCGKISTFIIPISLNLTLKQAVGDYCLDLKQAHCCECGINLFHTLLSGVCAVVDYFPLRTPGHTRFS